MKLGAPIPTAGRTLAARDELAREVRDAILQLKRELGAQAHCSPAVESALP